MQLIIMAYHNSPGLDLQHTQKPEENCNTSVAPEKSHCPIAEVGCVGPKCTDIAGYCKSGTTCSLTYTLISAGVLKQMMNKNVWTLFFSVSEVGEFNSHTYITERIPQMACIV